MAILDYKILIRFRSSLLRSYLKYASDHLYNMKTLGCLYNNFASDYLYKSIAAVHLYNNL